MKNMNIEAAIDQVKYLMSIPLSKRVSVVNSYIEINGLDVPKISLEEVEAHPGKEALLSHAYSRITRPHLTMSK